MKFFINNMLWLKKQNKFTQEDLADKLNVSRQSISKWERGEALPDLYNLQELAKIYKVSIDDLLNKDLANNASAIPENDTNIITNSFQNDISVKSAEGDDVNINFNDGSINVKSADGDSVVVSGAIGKLVTNVIKNNIDEDIGKIECSVISIGNKQALYYTILNEKALNIDLLDKIKTPTFITHEQIIDNEKYILIGIRNIDKLIEVINWDMLANDYINIFYKKNTYQLKSDKTKTINDKSKKIFRSYNTKCLIKMFYKAYKNNDEREEHFSYNCLKIK